MSEGAFVAMLNREIELAEQEIVAFARDYMADRVQGLIEGPFIEGLPVFEARRGW